MGNLTDEAALALSDSRQLADNALHIRGLHPAQRTVFTSPARFRILNAGRRFGKTRLGVVECVTRGIMGKRCWWVGPSYSYTQVAWRGLRSAAYALKRQGADIIVHEGAYLLNFPTGGWIQVRSADSPDSLRSEGLDFLVMDEAARIIESAWTDALRPALSDRRGDGLFISTPKGRNWYWRMYQNAQGEEWERWTFPTAANPFIAATEIEAARKSMPERSFRQEYLAEFIEEGSGVFRRIQEAATAKPQDQRIEADPQKKIRQHQYIFGVDWGKMDDFTVIIVLDLNERAVVYMDRFNQIDYSFQRERLKVLYERFHPACIVAESNSMGEPIIEQLQREGLPVEPFMTSNASKAQAVEAIALAFERDDLKIIPDETLIGELMAFESDRTASGATRYSAPSGMHDDCVMALAMAWTQAGEAGPHITGYI